MSKVRASRDQPLILKVDIGFMAATKTLRFEAHATVRDALILIAARCNLDGDANDIEQQYVLYKAQTEFTGIYLENLSSYLASNDFYQNVSLCAALSSKFTHSFSRIS